MPSPRILIFANGSLPDLEKARTLVQADDIIVCADGGTRHALALGLEPSLVIGDLDSLEEADRKTMLAAGVATQEYPRDKDETDLELALQYAVEQEPSAIVIVGALGARLDQTVANLSLLTDPRLAAIDCRLDDGVEAASFCRSVSRIEGRAGDLVSLVPWGDAVVGVQTDGLKWPLRGETLFPERTRGISNEMLSDSAQVRIESGLLLIIHRRR